MRTRHRFAAAAVTSLIGLSGALATSAHAADYNGPYLWSCGGKDVWLKGQQTSNSNSRWYVGQVVDADGSPLGMHYIPTRWQISVVDTTTGMVISSTDLAKGNGQAQAGQATTDCMRSHSRDAASYFNGTLPDGVAGTDTITSTTIVTAVARP